MELLGYNMNEVYFLLFVQIQSYEDDLVNRIQ